MSDDTVGPSGVDWGSWIEGTCPDCGSPVRQTVKTERCTNEQCGWHFIYP